MKCRAWQLCVYDEQSSHKMTIPLPRYEVAIYFIIYGVFLLYGIANIFSLRNDLIANTQYSFTSGWSIIGRKRDDSNDEWENFKLFLWRNFSWYFAHISLTEACRFLEPTLIPVAHSVLGLAFILATYQTQTVLTILCQLLTFYLVSRYFRKSVVWALACIWIAVINILKNSSKLYQHDTYVEYYEMLIALSWCILKCLSFCLSKIRHRDDDKLIGSFNLVNYFGYCLYFPTFICGPFMIYERYKGCISNSVATIEELEYRAKSLLRNGARIIGWLLFTDFALHFIYVFYLEQNITVVKSLNPWALYGFGYLMGQFFHCHYVVSYGIGITMAKFDRMDPPSQPKCIGRIHFYSDMWKYFDQGLYEFLFIYIYCSLCSKTGPRYKKVFASIVTFIFIFIWHGFYDYVLIWTVLNFVCLSVENVFKYFVKTAFYANLVRNFNFKNQKRIYALIGSQIFIPSSISNFYFFAGVDVGNYFMQRTYQSGLFNYLALSVCCYCIFQSAEFINEYDSHGIRSV